MKSKIKMLSILLVTVLAIASFGGCSARDRFKNTDLTPEPTVSSPESSDSANNFVGNTNQATAKALPNLFVGATVNTNSQTGNVVQNAFNGGTHPDDSRWATKAGETASIIWVNIELAAITEIKQVVITERVWATNDLRITKFRFYSAVGDTETLLKEVNPDNNFSYSNTAKTTTINLTAPVSSQKFILKFDINAEGKKQGANIVEIQGFPPIPVVEFDPEAPKGTTDFAVGSTVVASSVLDEPRKAENATLPYKTNFNNDTRWGTKNNPGFTTAELTFKAPAMIQFVKVSQYHGKIGGLWDNPQRIDNLQIELADEGKPYTVVASGVPVMLDNIGSEIVLSGVMTTLAVPMRAVRMRISIIPNARFTAGDGVNIKAMEAYGTAATAIPDRNTELEKAIALGNALAKKDYDAKAYAVFYSSLVTARKVYAMGASATEEQITAATTQLTAAISKLKNPTIG